MTKKSQITLFILLGLVLIIAISFFLLIYFEGKETELTRSDDSLDIFMVQGESMQSYYEGCARDAIKKANLEIGISESTKTEYEKKIIKETKQCMSPVIQHVISQGYGTHEKTPYCHVEFNDESISIFLDYPLSVYLPSFKYNLRKLHINFPRAQYVELGRTGRTVLESPDRNAKIIFPPSTVASFGQDSVKVGLKLTEKNFEGLSNSAVIGNMVYEGLPKGATFSQPAEFWISLRTEDLPSSASFDSLSIAWWDPVSNIWKAIPTEIEEGWAKAKITHFTKFAIVSNCINGEKFNSTLLVPLPDLFVQEYSYVIQKKESESEEQYLSRANKTFSEFCRNEIPSWKKEKFWLENEYGTITPTREEFMKILKEEDERIDLSIQSLPGEKYDFGDEDLCGGSVESMQFCCCKDSNSDNIPEECLPVPSTMQACWRTGEDYYIFDKEAVPLCPAGDYPNVEEEIIGYNKRECIGGNVKDGNNDFSVLELNFLENGDSCIYDSPDAIEFISNYNGVIDSENCIINYKLEDKSKPFRIIIESASVLPPGEGYCARCSAIVSIAGRGLENATVYPQCKNSKTAEIVSENGQLACRRCSELQDYPGIFVANGEKLSIESEECLCTWGLLGTAYCDIKKKCDIIDGNPMLTEWVNEEEISLCTKCSDPITKEGIEGCTKVVFR